MVVDDRDLAPTRRRRRWVRPLVILGLVLGVAGAIVVFYPTPQPPPIKLPDPNGYDDLDRAGRMIHGDWPNQGNVASAKIDELKAFVEANRASLDLARVGLGRDCVVPIENSQVGLARHFESYGRIRNLIRLLNAEARVREAEGHPVEAVRSYRDLLELGQAMTQGGLVLDVTTGWSMQGQAIGQIRKLRQELPNEAVVELLRDLDAMEKRRVSLEAIEARRLAWYLGTYDSWQRTLIRMHGLEQKTQQDEKQMLQTALTKLEGTWRFFQVEMAIHAFHEDRKTWPRSLNDLVPTYLAKVPLNPATKLPIDYPANSAGELTDDLTSIARPDGEIIARP